MAVRWAGRVEWEEPSVGLRPPAVWVLEQGSRPLWAQVSEPVDMESRVLLPSPRSRHSSHSLERFISPLPAPTACKRGFGRMQICHYHVHQLFPCPPSPVPFTTTFPTKQSWGLVV